MEPLARGPALALIAAASLALGACRLPRESPPPRYWMLMPVESSVSEAPVQRTVGVGPMSLPAYLDRTAVVTRSGPRLEVAPFDMWGQPLAENVTAVLGRNLEHLVPGTSVELFPWNVASRDLDQRVTVEFASFEAHSDGAVHLDASWELWGGGAGSKLLASGRAAIREPVANDKNVEEVTLAMSRALGQLSQDIAAHLEQR
jgi:uncharacterized lipoprotein YmbA